MRWKKRSKILITDKSADHRKTFAATSNTIWIFIVLYTQSFPKKIILKQNNKEIQQLMLILILWIVALKLWNYWKRRTKWKFKLYNLVWSVKKTESRELSFEKQKKKN